MLLLTLIALTVATEPAEPARDPETPAAETGSRVPSTEVAPAPNSTARNDPPGKAPPVAPVTIQTPGGARTVDLEDEGSWDGLSSSTKDKLRAERARRQAKAVAPTDVAPPATEIPDRDPERPPIRSAPPPRADGDLERYYKHKDRQLVITTAVLGGVWGVLTLTTIGLVSSGRGTPALHSAMAVFTSASGLGTIVSGTLLGAHRNTRPLYFTAGRGGVGVRF